ncbi:unnamed protein product [Rotaria sordida]|uniref:Uncharacterized protein n=1 Tax=Rotaria sordida TaxID=392033 RepID=A0A814Q536_9BILA|nr:unnamed protein product [Rotaria sordida]
MSNTIDTYLNNSLDSSQQEPLTILEQVVNLVQELKDTKDEQHQVNTELDQEIQTRLEAEPEVSQLCQQVQLVEVNLDNTTNHVNHLTTQLTDTTKVSEIEQHVDTNLENNLTPVEDKEINLDNQLRKTKSVTPSSSLDNCLPAQLVDSNKQRCALSIFEMATP